MAKRFGALDLVADTYTVLMTGATGFNSTANIRFVNRNSSPVTVRLALVDEPAVDAITNLSVEDYLEFDVEIRANGVLENSGIPIPEGFTLVARSNTNDVTVMAYGFEESKI